MSIEHGVEAERGHSNAPVLRCARRCSSTDQQVEQVDARGEEQVVEKLVGLVWREQKDDSP